MCTFASSLSLTASGPFQPSKNWPKNQPKILSQMSHFSAKFCRQLEQPRNITWKKNIGMGSGWKQKSHGLANTSIMQTRHGAAKLRFASPKAALLT
jgi:hypothetical protein